VVVTQRPSRVDPDVMSQMQSQVIMRIVNPKDQEAVRDSSEQLAQDYLDNLPGLDRGEAVVLGPIVKLPAVIRLRDRLLDYGGADISLVEAWRRRDVDVAAVWTRIFRSPPPPSVALAASRISVKSAEQDGGVWKAVTSDGAHVELSIESSYARCSLCGSSGCAHVYRVLSEVVKVRRAA